MGGTGPPQLGGYNESLVLSSKNQSPGRQIVRKRITKMERIPLRGIRTAYS